LLMLILGRIAYRAIQTSHASAIPNGQTDHPQTSVEQRMPSA
jgi:hypothetical protein